MFETYACAQIIWDTKAPLDSHNLEAPTASMDCILGNQIYQWKQEKTHVPKDKEAYECTDWKDWVHLVLHKGNYFNHALLAGHFAWTNFIR